MFITYVERADQSNGNFFIIPPSCEELSLRGLRALALTRTRFAEYYFRISIRTLNSNDHFTLSQPQLPVTLSPSLFLSLFLSPAFLLLLLLFLLLVLSLPSLKCGPNIFPGAFYHSTF